MKQKNDNNNLNKITSAQVGKKGENIAKNYLFLRGYKILERNYRKLHGEIDIIAKKFDTIIIVEVKTRTSYEFGSGFDAINSQKQHFLRRTAMCYMQKHPNLSIRFDAIEVYGEIRNNKFHKKKITHIKGAF